MCYMWGTYCAVTRVEFHPLEVVGRSSEPQLQVVEITILETARHIVSDQPLQYSTFAARGSTLVVRI